MHDEKREELTISAEQGRLVNQTIETKGWTEVIRPSLISVKGQYLAQFREAIEHKDFLVIQQSINSIDWLLAYIENTLAMGQDSLQQLKEEP